MTSLHTHAITRAPFTVSKLRPFIPVSSLVYACKARALTPERPLNSSCTPVREKPTPELALPSTGTDLTAAGHRGRCCGIARPARPVCKAGSLDPALGRQGFGLGLSSWLITDLSGSLHTQCTSRNAHRRWSALFAGALDVHACDKRKVLVRSC